ncbi:hypothetical protein SAMN06296056_11172 [Priestia filamentosa]|nr:hypothetical protein SAMN06296056_11172 [Priestia filamentosa]
MLINDKQSTTKLENKQQISNEKLTRVERRSRAKRENTKGKLELFIQFSRALSDFGTGFQKVIFTSILLSLVLILGFLGMTGQLNSEQLVYFSKAIIKFAIDSMQS